MDVNINNLKESVKNPYAWPGGYPTVYIMKDGGTICHKCARKNYRLIRQSMIDGYDEQWIIVGQEILYENDDQLYCDECNELHESAY